MLLLSALLSQFAFAQVPEKVLDLSEQQIWGMDFADTYALITTKSGKILRVDTATWKTAEITPKPESFDHGQGGLMDIRFHPDFKNNGWIYWTATVGNKDAQTTRLSRAKLEGTTLKGIETVFEARPIVDSGLHFGSRIAWDAGGALYLTLGERNERERAQKKEEHWGKVIRIAPDGTASIYTSGHRNPQGIARDPVSGEMFVSEHGPRGGDEVNRLVAGANYGWPKLTAGREYWGPKIADSNKGPGFESPLLTWVPSIAPGSLHFFSDRVHPSLRGRAAAGALKDQHLNLIAITRDPKTGKVSGLREEKRLWEGLKQRIRSLAEAPSGDFYIGTDSGQIYRVRAK
jgi:glucose/arabinose dehydrogenase